MPGDNTIAFLEETKALFPDFEWFEEEAVLEWEVGEDQTTPESALLVSVNDLIPQIQNASAEERIEAARIILG